MFYKLVTNRLESPYACCRFSIQYVERQWVEPKIPGSKLFVFDSLTVAKRHLSPGDVLYTCQVKNPTPIRYRLIFNSTSESNLIKFWKTSKGGLLKVKNAVRLISDYYVADAVKLMKRV